VFAECLLSGWLEEISANLLEAVAHYRRFATMRYTNPRTLLLLLTAGFSISLDTLYGHFGDNFTGDMIQPTAS